MAAARPSRSPLGLFAAAVAFLLCVLFSPLVAAPFWSPRAALLLIVIAVGLPIAVQLALAGHRAAIAALAFLGWAGLSTALADQPDLAFFGLYGWGTGWLFIAALVSTWAVGVAVPDGERTLVEKALLWGIAVNAVVALLQSVLDLGIEELRLVDGRAVALVGNSVQTGALMAGGIALVGARTVGPMPVGIALTTLFAAALQVSGSRFALGVAVVAAIVLALRLGARRGVVLALALVVGLSLGAAVGEVGGGTTSSERTTQTASGSAGGVRPRLETWWSARHAVADAPLFGAGPGQFRSATSRYRTLALARSEGPDRLFVDAHNVAVEYVVTTGIVGLVALALWAALALGGASGRLFAFALAILALHLVQPQGVDVTPLAALTVGVAGPAATLRLRSRAGAIILVPVAVAVGGAFFLGDFRLDQAVLDSDVDDALAATYILPSWSQPADVVARSHAYRWITGRDEQDLREAVRWTRRAVRRDPTDPVGWNRLGELEQRLLGSDAGAARFRRALVHDPWSVRARRGLLRVAEARGAHRAALELSREIRLVRRS